MLSKPAQQAAKVRLELVFIFKDIFVAKLFFSYSLFFVWNNKRNKMRQKEVSNQVPLVLKFSVCTTPLSDMFDD